MRIRSPVAIKNGYLTIMFSSPRKLRYLHRMVLETFVGPCIDGHEASHLNGIRSDCRLCNLAWECPKKNHARKVEHNTSYHGHRNPAAKLTLDQVMEIRHMDRRGVTGGEVGRKYGVARATIQRIWSGKSWVYPQAGRAE